MTDHIYIDNVLHQHMHGQIAIKYTDAAGKQWIQEGLGV